MRARIDRARARAAEKLARQVANAVNGKRTTLAKRRCRQCGGEMYTPVCQACLLKEANRRERRRFVELDPEITVQLDDPDHRERYLQVREARLRAPRSRATADGELVLLGDDRDEAEEP